MRLGEARRALVKAYDANKQVMGIKKEIRQNRSRSDFPTKAVVWELNNARTRRNAYLRIAGRIVVKGR